MGLDINRGKMAGLKTSSLGLDCSTRPSLIRRKFGVIRYQTLCLWLRTSSRLHGLRRLQCLSVVLRASGLVQFACQTRPVRRAMNPNSLPNSRFEVPIELNCCLVKTLH